MGFTYYLSRDDNKTLFELGKIMGSSMQELLDIPRFDRRDRRDEQAQPKNLPDEAELIIRLTREFSAPYWKYVDAASYAVLVAKRLITWADGHPVIFTDQDDVRADEYRVTGSRYIE